MSKALKSLLLIGNFIFLFFAVQLGYFEFFPIHPQLVDIGFDAFGALLATFILLAIPLLNLAVLFTQSEIRNRKLKTLSRWFIVIANGVLAACTLWVLAYRQSPLAGENYTQFSLHSYVLEIIVILLTTILSILVLVNKSRFTSVLRATLFALFIALNLFVAIHFLGLFIDEIHRSVDYYWWFYISISLTSVLGLVLLAIQGVKRSIRW
jgi:hypothetical protein